MQPIYQVTLKELREHGACVEGYNKVVRMVQGKPYTSEDEKRERHIRFKHEEPVRLVDIAKHNGVDDALWSLRCVQGCDRDSRLFAVWCARSVEHLIGDERSRNAINVAEKFASGDATEEELAAARDAAWDAAWGAARGAARAAAEAAAGAAARAAAWAAAWAAAGSAAWAAAGDAAGDAAGAAQLEMFIAMCEGRAPWQVQE